MNRRFSKIVSEEIDKFIKNTINEINNNIFQILERYRIDIVKRQQELEDSIDDYKALNNNDINEFIRNLTTFTIQLEEALRRCISNQSINEGLRDYGIRPPEQFSNLVNDFKYWYNWSNRNFFGKQGYGYGGYGRYGKNQNSKFGSSTQKEKLSVLLSNNLYKIERQYKK